MTWETVLYGVLGYMAFIWLMSRFLVIFLRGHDDEIGSGK